MIIVAQSVKLRWRLKARIFKPSAHITFLEALWQQSTTR
jgi:hypothetical protein